MIELLRRYAGAYRVNFIFGPLCKLIEVCFDLLTPVVIARMIDEGVGGRDVSAVLRSGAMLLGFALIGISFSLVCQKMASRASQGMGTVIRDGLYRRINEFSYAELDRFGTPSLITRITNDVNQVQLAMALAIRQLIRWPFLALGSVIAALLIDLRLGLIFLVCTPIVGGVFWLVMARCVPFFKSMQAKLDRIGLITREGLSGVRVIRAFVREDHERARFRAAAGDQAATAIAVGRLSSVLNPMTFLVMNLAICAILWQGGVEVNAGELTQGQVVAFVNYMTQTLLSIVYVANLVVVFTKASASAGRVLEVLDTEPTITSRTPTRHPEHTTPVTAPPCHPERRREAPESKDPSPVLTPLRHPESRPEAPLPPCHPERRAEGPESKDLPLPAIAFDHASFAFTPGAAHAVEDVSLALPVGGTLGIIGGTGSGKSTLISLIPRLYDTTSGSVEVLGRNVRDWQLDELRREIGLVPQQASLLSGTVRSNLTWRDPEASDAALWHALDIAQASEFVRKLSDGLDAPVEAGGKNFSGGQRQRLTIARALVGDPRLLILDDASSALDLRTDAALRRAVRSLGCTTVIVSQRVSAVRDADVICVMRRGSVVGLGTHGELLRGCEVYREICESQGVRESPAGESTASPEDANGGAA